MKIVENKILQHSEPHNHSEKKLFFLNETLSDIPRLSHICSKLQEELVGNKAKGQISKRVF